MWWVLINKCFEVYLADCGVEKIAMWSVYFWKPKCWWSCWINITGGTWVYIYISQDNVNFTFLIQIWGLLSKMWQRRLGLGCRPLRWSLSPWADCSYRLVQAYVTEMCYFRKFTMAALSAMYNVVNSVFTVYSYCILGVFTAYSYCIHRVFTAYSPCTQCTAAYSYAIHSVFTCYSYCIHYDFTMYSQWIQLYSQH